MDHLDDSCCCLSFSFSSTIGVAVAREHRSSWTFDSSWDAAKVHALFLYISYTVVYLQDQSRGEHTISARHPRRGETPLCRQKLTTRPASELGDEPSRYGMDEPTSSSTCQQPLVWLLIGHRLRLDEMKPGPNSRSIKSHLPMVGLK